MTIRTTDGKNFLNVESVDTASATAAWRRLLENSCPEADFMRLVNDATHTAHCEGNCKEHG